ncbi:MAG: methyltransferase domain-containing protein [Methylococcales bacterium]
MLKKWLSVFFGTHPPPMLYCPVCDRKPTIFLPLSDYFLENLRRYDYPYIDKGEMISLDTYSCESCGASDRERLYAFWIKQQIAEKTFFEGARLIHFAPEATLSKQLRALNFFDYASADLMMTDADHQVDITNMPFANDQFDFFICSHVLEHVDSDDAAISELYRILKKGGRGILVVPIVLGLEKTLEDPTITDAAERWRLFGQDDHVRLYAHDDYVNKIKQHGFSVAQLDQDYFGKLVFQSLGLKPTSILYIVTK